MENQPQSPTQFQRKIIMIKRGLQMKYVLLVFVTVLLTSLVVFLDVYYVVGKSVLLHYEEVNLLPVVKSATALLALHLSLYLLVVLICALFVSHRFAGPIYRLERVAESLAKGDLTVNVQFRKGDEFFETAEYMNRMIAALREKVQKDKHLSDRILAKLNDLSQKLEQGKVKGSEAPALVREIALEVQHISSGFKF